MGVEVSKNEAVGGETIPEAVYWGAVAGVTAAGRRDVYISDL